MHVAAAAIFGADGRLLITRRPDHVHQGGRWEFPGGKLEPGESAAEGLCRELEEELGIRPLSYHPLIRIPYRYPDKTVLLDVWRVTEYQGVPHGREGQPLKWLKPESLKAEEFPAANKPIIDALLLPEGYLITGQFATEAEFMQRLEKALERGVRMVQFRVRDYPHSQVSILAEKARKLCRDAGALFIVNGNAALAHQIGADGIHLTSAQLLDDSMELKEWAGKWLGASCHNEQELHRAESLRVCYVSLSPVLPTASHPGSPALGWERFRELTEQVAVPVFALGGMNTGLLRQVRQHGGQGIAAIREFWG